MVEKPYAQNNIWSFVRFIQGERTVTTQSQDATVPASQLWLTGPAPTQVTERTLTRGADSLHTTVTPLLQNLDWASVTAEGLVRCQERDPFDPRLSDEQSVEGILVDGWEQVHRHRVSAGNGQFRVTVLE